MSCGTTTSSTPQQVQYVFSRLLIPALSVLYIQSRVVYFPQGKVGFGFFSPDFVELLETRNWRAFKYIIHLTSTERGGLVAKI
jgi:hypothetical protein